MRKQAETPWFQSFLAFDPGQALKDTGQPILVAQGELDTQVQPYHADKLAELARARKRKADVQVLKVPGINHLLVPAKTGEVDEYRSLGPNAQVSPGAHIWNRDLVDEDARGGWEEIDTCQLTDRPNDRSTDC